MARPIVLQFVVVFVLAKEIFFDGVWLVLFDMA